ncbi:MAG: nitrogenase stabilizing/protective protein NifW [Rhodopila sp.]|jgi:nitrogenase-stabilizing/protective protein
MTTMDELGSMSGAEDFFAALDLPYDPAILNVARLHIMRRMGQYLSGTERTGLDDDDAVPRACRLHLERAYQDFVRSSPIVERMFKVHQDAIKPAEPPSKPFVPLTALTGAASE